jgi:dipeptidyl aminopeptidase/acylaminoacyl peptidase
MRKFVLGLCLLAGTGLSAQTHLTVPMIMQDPKWIGTSPEGVFWSPDSKQVFFNWNPDSNPSDSAYQVTVSSTSPSKLDYRLFRRLQAEHEGTYNKKRTLLVYSLEDDLYLLDLVTGQTKRITHTEASESNPQFVKNDAWIVYQVEDNLFAWDRTEGTTLQLTKFVKGGDATPAPAQHGGRRGGNAVSSGNPQEQWLQKEQLEWMQVVKERKDKKDARQAYLKAEKDPDTLKVINVGDKSILNPAISPDGRYVTYNVYQAPTGVKNTIVPAYVTESGFTTDIPGRSKVGAPEGNEWLYVYDRSKDTVIEVKTDILPGITDEPAYRKDYPADTGKKASSRLLEFDGTYWNEEGTAALLDIRSQDVKDRWLMSLDASTGRLTLVDHQRDTAWIGGPGIGWLSPGNGGWVNAQTCWFQSEVTGYTHLYTYDIVRKEKKTLTSGTYEVQEAFLSHDKKYFYIQTNEEHPGKQNWYRLKSEGGKAEKITSMTGQYDEMTLSPDEHWMAYRYSYINKPWELYIQENLPGKKPIKVTDKAASAAFTAYPWRDTRIFTIPARDGKQIYARIYDPAPGKKNGAAVIFVHGAGYLQNVDYGWSYYFREYMFNNLLADEGYTVLDIDYRASAGYGRDWRTAIYRHMGGKDLDDEVDAAHYLIREQGIDSARIGMYGGSYGGFMTLMALFTQPGVFKAGAALRSVTDWAHYNHAYTAAILNEPFTDSIAYRRSSPIYFASGLQDHLLICHGMVDENVNFQDDVRLAQRLIELGKDNWELAVYPMEDHGFVEPSSWTDEYKRIKKLFDTYLLK